MPDEGDKTGRGTLQAVYGLWLEKLRDAAEQNPLLAKVVEALIVVPFLGLGLDGIVQFNLGNLFVGFVPGIPAAYWLFGREEPSVVLGVCVAIPLIGVGGFENIIMPLREMREPEWTPGLVEFCIGATLAVAAGCLTSHSSNRNLRLYCCGAFLGPVVCYHFVVGPFRQMIGPFIVSGGDSAEQGHLIAILVGFALSAEMLLLHAGRVRASAVEPVPPTADQRASPVPVMTPLTFAVGLILGSGTMLLLLGLWLMLLLWPAGLVVAPVLLAITWYALHLR